MNVNNPDDRMRLRAFFANNQTYRCDPKQNKCGGDPYFLCACDELPKLGTVESTCIVMEYVCGCKFAYHQKCAPAKVKQLAQPARGH